MDETGHREFTFIKQLGHESCESVVFLTQDSQGIQRYVTRCSYFNKQMDQTLWNRQKMDWEFANQIQDKLAAFKLAPKIFAKWICEDGAMVVMRRLQESVQERLERFFLDQMETKQPVVLPAQLIKAMWSKLSQMHRLGIYHNDLSFRNIMLGVKGHLYFIDFNTAGLLTKQNFNRRIQKDYTDIFEEVEINLFEVAEKFFYRQDQMRHKELLEEFKQTMKPHIDSLLRNSNKKKQKDLLLAQTSFPHE